MSRAILKLFDGGDEIVGAIQSHCGEERSFRRVRRVGIFNVGGSTKFESRELNYFRARRCDLLHRGWRLRRDESAQLGEAGEGIHRAVVIICPAPLGVGFLLPGIIP